MYVMCVKCICMYGCMHVCVYVCMYVCMYTRTLTHARARAHTHTHTHTISFSTTSHLAQSAIGMCNVADFRERVQLRSWCLSRLSSSGSRLLAAVCSLHMAHTRYVYVHTQTLSLSLPVSVSRTHTRTRTHVSLGHARYR